MSLQLESSFFFPGWEQWTGLTCRLQPSLSQSLQLDLRLKASLIIVPGFYLALAWHHIDYTFSFSPAFTACLSLRHSSLFLFCNYFSLAKCQ